MAERHFNAAADAVARGMSLGIGMKERERDNARADRRLALYENADMRATQRHSSAMAEDELDAAVRAKKRTAMAAEIDFDMELKKDALKRFSEADEALSRFSAGLDLIDWGSPESGAQYEGITRQYLPKIIKDDRILRKFEALDGATKKGQAFTATRVMEASLVTAMKEAASIAPELVAAPPKRPDGSVDFEAFRTSLEERRRQMHTEELELQREKSARTSGAPRMRPSDKAELDMISDELKGVTKALTDLEVSGKGVDPDAKLRLVNRKASLLRRLRQFDDMEQAEPTGKSDQPSPQQQPQSQPAPAATGGKQVGRFRMFLE